MSLPWYFSRLKYTYRLPRALQVDGDRARRPRRDGAHTLAVMRYVVLGFRFIAYGAASRGPVLEKETSPVVVSKEALEAFHSAFLRGLLKPSQ